jgi:hypothetical protein
MARAGSVDVESRSASEDRSPLTPNRAALLRVQKRPSPVSTAGDEASSGVWQQNYGDKLTICPVVS